MNIAGLKPQTTPSKVPFIKGVLKDKNQLFIGLTETWLKRHKQAELTIDGYKLYRSDRTGRKHTHGRFSGGTGLYLRSDLAATSEQLLKFSNGVVEALVTYSQKENLLLAVVYRQPDASSSNYRSGATELTEALNAISTSIDNIQGTPDIILCGDFNLPGINWKSGLNLSTTNALHKSMFEFQDKHFLSQLVAKPTHSAGNILDLIFTNNRQLIQEISSNHTTYSDHYHVEASTFFKSHFARTQKQTRTFSNVFDTLNFFSDDVDWQQLENALEQVDWSSEFNGKTPTEKYHHLISICENTSKIHVPHKRSAIPRKSKIPRDRRILMRRRTKINKQLNKHQTPSKRQQLTKELVEIELKFQDSYKKSYSAQEQKAIDAIKKNPKYFFTYVKKFSKVKSSIGPLLNEANQYAVENAEMADILSKQYASVFSIPREPLPDPFDIFNGADPTKLNDIDFTESDIIEAIDELSNNASAGPDGFPAILLKQLKTVLAKPLYLLWRHSLDDSICPMKAKENSITPIHKSESTAIAANYRPVALTSHLIKIFEKVLRKKIVEYLDANNLFNSTQHGFRAGRSCLSQLLAHYDKILTLLDQGFNVDVVYLDFAKAFDKLDFNITLAKLKSLGIDGKIGRWLHSFLTNRLQTVIVNGTKSSPAPVISGVPQGSVIGPLLFLILIGDIDKEVAHSFLSSFADDTRIGLAISTPDDAKQLQQDLQAVYDWAATNNMQFNDTKFELLRYGTNQDLKSETSYSSNTGKQIQEKLSTKDLGVIMSSSADFKAHIESVTETVKDLSSWILRSFKSRSKHVMLQLWKSIVIPRLDYCSQLWSPHQVYLIKSLEDLQKAFIRNIHGFRHMSYWMALKELGLYSLQRRRERYQMIYLWSILEGQVPNIKSNGQDLIKVQSEPSSRLGRTIQTRPLKNTRFANLRFNSLPFHGARLFNQLPKDVRNLTGCSKMTFKASIDNFLSTISDEPQILSCSNTLSQVSSNSLIDHLAGANTTSLSYRCGKIALVGGR